MRSEERDELFVRTIGNLVSDPILYDNGNGNKVCVCKIATNPPALRFNPKTRKPIPNEERNKTRTIMQIRITNARKAEEFANNFGEGDRVQVEGDCTSKEVAKMCYSKKENRWIPCIINIDGDIVHITESRLVMDASRVIAIATDYGKNRKVFSA